MKRNKNPATNNLDNARCLHKDGTVISTHVTFQPLQDLFKHNPHIGSKNSNSSVRAVRAFLTPETSLNPQEVVFRIPPYPSILHAKFFKNISHQTPFCNRGLEKIGAYKGGKP
jgi:hypothetical protein